MGDELLKKVTFFSLFSFVFISTSPRAFAEHAAAIPISPEATYPLFFYIFILVGVLLVAGGVMVWRLTRKISSQKKASVPVEKTMEKRKFFIIATIMAAIGFLSSGFFYFIISSMVNLH